MSLSSLSAAAPAAALSVRDSEAPWRNAVDRYGVLMHRYIAVRVGGDSALADDLSQQLWLQARHAVEQLPSGEIEFWLRSVAKNLIRTHWRRVLARPPAAPLADATLAAEIAEQLTREELPAATLERREARDQLLLAITELGYDDQTLIVGHYFEGRSHQELASLIGVSARGIEGRLYRARLALREKLNHLE